ncbi:hypothetical protein EXW08_13280 [Enterococcus faecium]|nr:hypothetical protein [Enterococcus faecium]
MNWLSLTLFYRRDFLFCMDFFIYTKYFTLSSWIIYIGCLCIISNKKVLFFYSFLDILLTI